MILLWRSLSSVRNNSRPILKKPEENFRNDSRGSLSQKIDCFCPPEPYAVPLLKHGYAELASAQHMNPDEWVFHSTDGGAKRFGFCFAKLTPGSLPRQMFRPTPARAILCPMSGANQIEGIGFAFSCLLICRVWQGSREEGIITVAREVEAASQ